MITENYILMCERAEEIQKERKNEGGNRYVKAIWLPTLEQLFEMVWDIEDKLDFSHDFNFVRFDRYERIHLMVKSEGSIHIQEYCGQSFQECLLQFIFKEKYNKVWENNKWKA